MILVEIRCKAKGCGKLLKTVDKRPPTWEGELGVPVCRKHTEGAIRPRGFLGWARSQALAGHSPPFMATLGRTVPWSDLRPAIEKAERFGCTVVETV